MGAVSSEQLRQADRKASLTKEAENLVMQAGNGLAEVYDECRTNTAGLRTAAKIQVIQGLLTEATVILLESETDAKIQVPG